MDANDIKYPGQAEGLAQLTPDLYRQLRRLARRYMQREHQGHTYQATELLNEALSRLAIGSSEFVDRKHFYCVCATQMRHILVEHARRKRHRGGRDLTAFDHEEMMPTTQDGFDIVLLDTALRKFEHLEPTAAKAFELHYFGGLTLAESAEIMGVGDATVTRYLRLAKAWLITQLDPKYTNAGPSPAS